MPLHIGTLELTSKYRYGITSHGTPIYLFRPYDMELPEFVVGCSTRDLTYNQIALVDTGESKEIVPNQRPRANLIRLLGRVGDFESERKALLLHYGSSSAFKKIKTVDAVDASMDGHRIELSSATGWYTYHVDPPGCRDIDDAIAFHPETGETAITIADAAAAVKVDSDVDRAAKAIGATFYSLEGKVEIPMLPSSISEESASLTPGHRRRGVSLIIDSEGRETFLLSWITVEHSYTYESLEDSHAMIEELMIRYNAAVARQLKTAGAGLLRIQGPADAKKVATWSLIDKSLANEAATYVDITPSMTESTRHTTLDLDAYCHASSPLRRYADLVNQRILKQVIAGVEAEGSGVAAHLNERTKANRRWARDLTFLTHVTPGKVHQISVVWLSNELLWVPDWKRIIRARHERKGETLYDRIAIFCDPTQRSWKTRILTASIA